MKAIWSRDSAARIYVFALAFALLTPPIHLLVLGALGLQGSSTLTGAVYGIPIAILVASGLRLRAKTTATAIDVAFALFFAGASVSLVLWFDVANTKEYFMFLLFSGGAFVAGRLFPVELASEAQRCVLWTAAGAVAIGLLVTLPFLAQVWSIPLARPQVMGFPHAATLFAYASAILMLAFIASPCPDRLWSDALFLGVLGAATLIFMLALVRFMFVAAGLTVAALWVVWSLRRKEPRLARLITASLVLLGCFAGAALLRPSVAAFAQKAMVTALPDFAQKPMVTAPPEFAQKAMVTAPPSCANAADMSNSVHIRLRLLQDALAALPSAGWFGYGLDAFQTKLTCLRGFSPHNSLLQAAIEFGWLAGLTFLALLVLPLRLLFGRRGLFIASLFLFIALLTFAHGRISRQPMLFLLLGASAAIVSSTWHGEGHEARGRRATRA